MFKLDEEKSKKAAQANNEIMPTKVNLYNNSRKDFNLKKVLAENLTSKPKDPLPAGGFDSLGSQPKERKFDIGALEYAYTSTASCVFFWKKEFDKKNGKYAFDFQALGSNTKIDCTAKQRVADPINGDYKLEFRIK